MTCQIARKCRLVMTAFLGACKNFSSGYCLAFLGLIGVLVTNISFETLSGSHGSGAPTNVLSIDITLPSIPMGGKCSARFGSILIICSGSVLTSSSSVAILLD